MANYWELTVDARSHFAWLAGVLFVTIVIPITVVFSACVVCENEALLRPGEPCKSEILSSQIA